MLAHVARRVVASVLVLLAATAITFVLVDRTTDPLATLRARQPPVPASTIESTSERLYLDRPVVERYWLWLTGIGDTSGDIGVLRGQWGPSVRGVDIGEELGDRLLTTFRLVGGAVVITVLLAVWLGGMSARRVGSRLDVVVRVAGYFALVVPTFWLAAIAKQGAVRLNELVGHRVLHTVGATAPDGGGAIDVLGHLALPTFVLVLGAWAGLARYHRAAMLDALDSPHLRLARATGVPRRTSERRHALRQALVPTTTAVAVGVGAAVAGSIVVERAFRWRGLGTFLLDASGAADTYAVLAFVLVTGAAVVAANLCADVVVAVLDPRTRDDG